MPTTFTIGFSPCPNDTFIFDALVNRKIDTGDLRFEAVLEDVETLNKWALEGRLDISKMSFPALFQSLDNYILLNSGSALGKGVGPLLVEGGRGKAEGERKGRKVDVEKCSIAIPGINTTANLLMSFTYPDAKNKIPMIFSSIEDAVLEGKTDLGVIIHENRFTYQQRGLKKVSDLGEYWENKMRVPIPLGGIAAKRKTDKLLIRQIDQLIRRSLEFAFENYPVITDYVRDHSQAMDETVMRQHIDLYVNDYSLSLGEDGKAAIRKLKEIYDSLNNIETATGKEVNLFVS